METAHGETGDRPVSFVGDGAILRVDELYDLRESQLIVAILISWQLVGHHGFVGMVLCGLTRGRLLAGVAIRHDNDHRLSLACGDQVIHDACHVAQLYPCGLVATAAMQQVEDGIGLVLLAIEGRQIDGESAIGLQAVGMVPGGDHVAVGHILHLILVGIATIDEEDTEDIAYVTFGERVHRVEIHHAVDAEAIGVHLGGEHWRRVFPDTRFVLFHLALSLVGLPVAQYEHLLGLVGLQTESDAVVWIDLRGLDVSFAETYVLLCVCDPCPEKAEDQEEKISHC